MAAWQQDAIARLYTNRTLSAADLDDLYALAKDEAGIPDPKRRVPRKLEDAQVAPLELDINYIYRKPLWPLKHQDSKAVGSRHVTGISVLDIHELVGGKLAALLARRASRDLFDAHDLLARHELDSDTLRAAFVLYGR